MLVLMLAAALLQPAPPPLRTVGKGPMSAIDQPRQVTVRTAAEWAALWKQNGANARAAAPPAQLNTQSSTEEPCAAV